MRESVAREAEAVTSVVWILDDVVEGLILVFSCEEGGDDDDEEEKEEVNPSSSPSSLIR